MKKTFTIVFLILLLFLIPNFCSAYSLYNYDDLNDLTYCNVNDFISHFNIDNTKILTALNRSNFGYAFAFKDNNDNLGFVICFGDYNYILNSSYFSTYNNCAIYRGDSKNFYNTNGVVISSSNNLNSDIIIGSYGFNEYLLTDCNNLPLDAVDNLICLNGSTLNYYYNDNLLNIDISSLIPDEPEEPEEPSETIDYNSRLDFIINLLFLTVFLQFLFTIYYVIRSTFRYD